MAIGTTLSVDLSSATREYYSKEILEKALPNLVFFSFAKKKDDLTKNPGDTITFTRFADLGLGEELTEDVKLSEEKMTDEEVKIAVKEYGKATAVSQKSLATNMFDELDVAATKLSKSYQKTLDGVIRDAALTTTNQIYGGEVASADLLIAGSIMDMATVREAVKKLEEADAPKIMNEYYICVATPHQISKLKTDDDWFNANAYAGTRNIFTGEVGMIDGVIFISTTQMPKLSAADSLAKYGCNIETHEALMFGENAFAVAEALPVELRQNDDTDYGRKQGLAWYSIFNAGLVDEDYIYSLLTA